MLVYRQRQRK